MWEHNEIVKDWNMMGGGELVDDIDGLWAFTVLLTYKSYYVSYYKNYLKK